MNDADAWDRFAIACMTLFYAVEDATRSGEVLPPPVMSAFHSTRDARDRWRGPR